MNEFIRIWITDLKILLNFPRALGFNFNDRMNDLYFSSTLWLDNFSQNFIFSNFIDFIMKKKWRFFNAKKTYLATFVILLKNTRHEVCLICDSMFFCLLFVMNPIKAVHYITQQRLLIESLWWFSNELLVTVTQNVVNNSRNVFVTKQYYHE